MEHWQMYHSGNVILCISDVSTVPCQYLIVSILSTSDTLIYLYVCFCPGKMLHPGTLKHLNEPALRSAEVHKPDRLISPRFRFRIQQSNTTMLDPIRRFFFFLFFPHSTHGDGNAAYTHDRPQKYLNQCLIVSSTAHNEKRKYPNSSNGVIA